MRYCRLIAASYDFEPFTLLAMAQKNNAVGPQFPCFAADSALLLSHITVADPPPALLTVLKF